MQEWSTTLTDKGGHEDTVAVQSTSPLEAKRQAITMMRGLISMTTSLAPLPDQRMITLRLLFNGKMRYFQMDHTLNIFVDECPPDWTPDQFIPSKLTFPETFTGESLKVKLVRYALILKER